MRGSEYFMSCLHRNRRMQVCTGVVSQTIHIRSECYDRYGFKCRFLGGHFRVDEYGKPVLVVDEKQKARAAITAREVNFIGSDVQKQLHSRKVLPPILHVDNADLSFCYSILTLLPTHTYVSCKSKTIPKPNQNQLLLLKLNK